MKQSQQGFTLIELMITVAIVAILAAVAYPSYTSQIRRSHRTDGRNVLLQIQVAQEKYFLQNNKYVSTNAVMVASTSASTPGLGIQTTSPDGYYTVSLEQGAGSSNTAYTATATATGSQTADSHCSKLVITSTGDKSASTNSDCWSR